MKAALITAILSGVLQTCMPIAALAAEKPTARTWDQCVIEASSHNAELAAALKSFESSQSLVQSAKSGYLPQVSANFDYSYGSANTGVPNSAASYYSTGLSASENLFTGFQDQARVRQASANQVISGAALNTTRAKVSFDLKSAFQGLVYAQNYVKLTGAIIRRREDNLRLVELRFESGRENKGSELLSKAYLAEAKLDALQARDSVQLARVQLAKVLGRDDPDDLEVSSEASLGVPVSEPAQDPDLKQLALKTPDHTQAVAQQDSAEASLTLARGGFFPSFTLSWQASKQGYNFFPDTDRWSFVAGLSIPLFNGGRDYYNTKSASAQVFAAEFSRASVDRQLLSKLRQAYSTYLEAVERLKVDQVFFEAATTRAQIGRAKYNNGLLTFEDWDLIENDLITREKNFLQSQRDRVVSEAAWEQALGRGVIQ